MTQWIDVVDSAIKIGLGGLIGGGATFAVERHRARVKRIEEIAQRQTSLVVEPVVAFMDEVLATISELYWSWIDGIPVDHDRLMAFRVRESAVEARVEALRDEALMDDWRKFQPSLRNIQNWMSKPSGESETRQERSHAISAAAVIIRRLLELDRLANRQEI